MRTPFAMIAAVLALAALPALADEAKIHVSKEAWAGFEQYKASITSTGVGYFAIAKNGGAFGWGNCGVDECASTNLAKEAAISRCEEYAGKGACVIFARNEEIEVPYEAPH